MWFLKRKHDGIVIYDDIVKVAIFTSLFNSGKQVYLVAKEYSIGRKSCTIEITDDATVSRKHCKIMVEKLQVAL